MPEVHLPPLGETIDEARISVWLKAVGDHVRADEPFVSVETDKVETEIPAGVDGVVTALHAEEGDTVPVGSVLITVGDAAATSEPTSAPAAPVTQAAAATAPPAPATPALPAGSAGSGRLAPRDARVRSPLVRRLLVEHGLDPATVTGTGPDGRIRRDDVLAAVGGAAPATQPAAPAAPAPVAPAPAAPAAAAPTPAAPAPTAAEVPTADFADDPRWERFPRIRKVTGQRMLLSATTIPQVTTVIELDYERVHQARARHGRAYKERTGHSLTYLPFVALATANAVREFPHVNATVQGDGLLVHSELHLGIAVDLDFKGLVVPVVRDAHELRLEALAQRMSSLAGDARAKRLGIDQLTGSTLTITNPGGYGTHSGTPLVNPPEVAILCVEGIKQQPVAVQTDDGSTALAFHHIGHLSLTWDHRAIDGAYAAAFLAKIRNEIETRDWDDLLRA